MRTNKSYLTPREAQIIGMMVNGQTYADICAALKIKAPTLKSHVSNVRDRLEAANVKQTIAICVQRGLINFVI